MGEAIDLGNGWQIKVLNVIPNANEIIRNENSFNSPPEDGYQYFLVKIEAKNIGSEADQFCDPCLNLVGISNVGYEPINLVIPDRTPLTEVFPGGVFTGNTVWEVKQSDVDSLVMYHRYAKNKIFFSLEPSSPIKAIDGASNPEVTGAAQKNPWVSTPTNNSTSLNGTIDTLPQSRIKSDPSSYSNPCDKTVYVHGYYRKDGTYVAPYYRSPPGCK